MKWWLAYFGMLQVKTFLLRNRKIGALEVETKAHIPPASQLGGLVLVSYSECVGILGGGAQTEWIWCWAGERVEHPTKSPADLSGTLNHVRDLNGADLYIKTQCASLMGRQIHEFNPRCFRPGCLLIWTHTRVCCSCLKVNNTGIKIQIDI